jgi:hypothetical protein
MIPIPTETPTAIQIWPIDKLLLYTRNPRRNDAAVDRICGSICAGCARKEPLVDGPDFYL